ncbi:MAG: PLP-dependent transferase [Marinagarivorans sp.]|nr:PLP-dependent transferase [Marinagarivorans sp.]
MFIRATPILPVRAFEERIAALECAESAVGTSSGMAAILSTCIALLKSGDHIVCSRSVFGTTTVLLTKFMQKFGVTTTLLRQRIMQLGTRLLRLQLKSCLLKRHRIPCVMLIDIQRLADITHAHSALLVVDNCFCTPALQRPLELGADLIVHSATKYIDGQGRCLGGVVAGPKVLVDEVVGFIRSAGPSLSPFNAWIFLKGLETLSLRMEASLAQCT